MTTVNEISALVRNLPIPIPWDRSTFIESVGRVRGRRITLFPYDAAVTGFPPSLLLARQTDDLIGYATSEDEDALDHVILHNVGHLLLKHIGLGSTDLSTLFPDLNAATVREVLDSDGDSRDRDHEHEADVFAAMVRIAAWTP